MTFQAGLSCNGCILCWGRPTLDAAKYNHRPDNRAVASRMSLFTVFT
jgi:hypothetical protein